MSTSMLLPSTLLLPFPGPRTPCRRPPQPLLHATRTQQQQQQQQPQRRRPARLAPPRAAAAGGGDAKTVRINKAFREFASRREADRFVAEGRVTINGAVAEPGQRIAPGDEVALDGRRVDWRALAAELAPPEQPPRHDGSGGARRAAAGGAATRGGGERGRERGGDDGAAPLPMESAFVYVKYWKPRGVTCTTDERVRGNVAGAVRHPSGARLFPVGRLDKDSTGLLLLTSDGRVPNAVLRAAHGHAKLYRVTAHRRVADADVARLAAGVVITTTQQRDRGPPKELTAPTRPCRVARDASDPRGAALLIELREGRNRQIRRMLDALGYDTLSLHRLQFLGIGLAGLRPGEWAELDEAEMRVVRRAVRRAQAAAAAEGGDGVGVGVGGSGVGGGSMPPPAAGRC